MELQLWMALTIATRRGPSFASLLFSFLSSPGLATRVGINRSWHVLNYAREPEAWWSQGQAGVAELFCCTMLCYSGLTERCVLKLQDQWHASLFDYGKYEVCI